MVSVVGNCDSSSFLQNRTSSISCHCIHLSIYGLKFENDKNPDIWKFHFRSAVFWEPPFSKLCLDHNWWNLNVHGRLLIWSFKLTWDNQFKVWTIHNPYYWHYWPTRSVSFPSQLSPLWGPLTSPSIQMGSAVILRHWVNKSRKLLEFLAPVYFYTIPING